MSAIVVEDSACAHVISLGACSHARQGLCTPTMSPASTPSVFSAAAKSIAPLLVIFAVAFAVDRALDGQTFVAILVQSIAIHVVLAVSLNIVNGMTGQFSIGHAGFMAVGAYVAGVCGKALWPDAEGVTGQAAYVVSLLVGGCTAAFFGFLVGLPSLRLRGDYLAIVTLGFSEIIRVVVQNTEVFGKALGLSGVPHRTTVTSTLVLAMGTVLIARRLLQSAHGRSLLAVREDEIAAESMGVHTTSYKVRAFVIASFFAGLAGGAFSHLFSITAPSSFTYVKSMEIVVMVVAGGLGSISGAVIAAIVLTYLPEGLRDLFMRISDDPAISSLVEQVRMPVYGVILVLLMLLRPQGLFGTREIWDLPFVRRWFLRSKT
jgi:branched-chain amino acid transport system permease protein